MPGCDVDGHLLSRTPEISPFVGGTAAFRCCFRLFPLPLLFRLSFRDELFGLLLFSLQLLLGLLVGVHRGAVGRGRRRGRLALFFLTGRNVCRPGGALELALEKQELVDVRFLMVTMGEGVLGLVTRQ